MKKSLTIRAEEVDLVSWTSSAEKSGMTISEWVRRRLSAEVAPVVEREQHAGSQHQGLRGIPAVPVVRRRPRVAAGPDRNSPDPASSVTEGGDAPRIENDLTGSIEKERNTPATDGAEPVPNESAPKRQPKKKESAHCKHGTPRGYRCWQCGGLAIIPGDEKKDDKKSKKRR